MPMHAMMDESKATRENQAIMAEVDLTCLRPCKKVAYQYNMMQVMKWPCCPLVVKGWMGGC
jgi:hypothetical protein